MINTVYREREADMKVTYEKALKALRKLDPEYVYKANHSVCSYVESDVDIDVPSCGVGQVMHKDFGVSISDLRKWDRLGTVTSVVQRIRTARL